MLSATNNETEGADYWLKYYGNLPDYYISRPQLEALGWKYGDRPSKFAPGRMYGGDIFYNSDRKLPHKIGRIWHEADINYNVVFHSLRHSSTTYKLKLNHGDLKATQGDTGHAEIDMITKVYAHILDEDRKINAQKFESAFYSNPDLRQSKPPQTQPETPTVDINLLIEQLKNSPELANMLASILSGEKAAASLN